MNIKKEHIRKAINKKLLAGVLLVTMVMTQFSSVAFAQDESTDVTKTGLNLADNVPTEVTVYKAGSGTITYTPADGDTKAKIILDHATIDSGDDNWKDLTYNTGVTGIWLADNTSYEIQLIGENTISRCYEAISPKNHNQKVGPSVCITGSGSLNLNNIRIAFNALDLDVENTTLTASNLTEALYLSGEAVIRNSKITADSIPGGKLGCPLIGPSKLLIEDSDVKLDSTTGGIFCVGNDSELIIKNSKLEINASNSHAIYYTGSNPVVIEDSELIWNALDTTSAGIYSSAADIQIGGDSQVKATGGAKLGGLFCVNGNISISDNSVVDLEGRVGAYAPNGTIYVNDMSEVIARGTGWASTAFDTSGYSPAGCDIQVNSEMNEEGAFTWDGTTPVRGTYKYLHISPKKHVVLVTAGEHGSASASVSAAVSGAAVTLTATPDSGYRFKEWNVVSGGSITITDNSFTMPDEDVAIHATFELIPNSSGGSSGGSSSGSTPSTNREDYTIPVRNEDTVSVSATITDGKAVVSDITEETLRSVVNHPDKESQIDTVTIDLSGAKQSVTSVSLSKTSVKTLSDAVTDKSNGIDYVAVELTNATVTLDGRTLQTLGEQAAGSRIELVVENTKQENLNAVQKSALEQYQVATTFEAYFVSDGARIHDFNGGSAVVAVKFAPETGKDADYYHVVYVAEDGTLTYYPTRYKNGRLEFTTTHFSDYAIIYDESEKNDTDSDDSSEETPIQVDTSYAALRLRVIKSAKNSNVLKWTKYTGADGYVIYGSQCNIGGRKYKLVKLADVSGDQTTWTSTKLKKGTYYKYNVKAYKLVDGRQVWLATAKVVHATTTGGKYGNAKGVRVNQAKFTLTAGERAVIRAEQIRERLPIKHHTDIKFESSDPSVVTVNRSGVIRAKQKGTAYIYVYAQNGIYKKVRVIVK